MYLTLPKYVNDSRLQQTANDRHRADPKTRKLTFKVDIKNFVNPLLLRAEDPMAIGICFTTFSFNHKDFKVNNHSHKKTVCTCR